MNTIRLENLLREVSAEIISLNNEGYEVEIKLPNHFIQNCELRITKPTIILKEPYSNSSYVNQGKQVSERYVSQD